MRTSQHKRKSFALSVGRIRESLGTGKSVSVPVQRPLTEYRYDKKRGNFVKAPEVKRSLFNSNEAGQYLGGLCPKTLARWRKQGKGPIFIDMEGNYFYRKEDLDIYLERRTVHPEENVA
jgi:hypothetical protein